MLTLQWILQVLLTNEFVKIDCLAHAGGFLDVNRAWTGNGGVGLVLCLEWKLWGVFGLLTVVKALINTINSQISPFCPSFTKIWPIINKILCCEPTHLGFYSFCFKKFFYDSKQTNKNQIKLTH